jgi:hypothetical protein
MTRLGRPNRPARPWLGSYATETENKVVVIGVATRGPAKQAGVEAGDIVLAVAGRAVGTLASFFREDHAEMHRPRRRLPDQAPALCVCGEAWCQNLSEGPPQRLQERHSIAGSIRSLRPLSDSSQALERLL